MVKRFFLKLIKFYQVFISSGLGRHCRFYPSCSQYMYMAIEQKGFSAGALKGCKRILRCNPWHEGGVDMP